jgi:uncharacterized membrane protein (DUF2068 family)
VAENRDRLLLVIGAFKLLKAALLTMTGLAILLISPEGVAARLQGAVGFVGVAPGGQLLGRLTERLLSLDEKTARYLGALALVYAAVFVTEGAGLILRRRWAEWLTVVVTASFIPFEIYELCVRFGAGKVITLILNAAIVFYLVVRRLRERRSAHSAVTVRKDG